MLVLIVVVPQNLGAQLEPRISLYSSAHDLSGIPGSLLTSSDNITANPVRNLPDSVHPGDTFNVTVNFTAPDDNFSNVYITDNAPSGWTVNVQGAWCSPTPGFVLATNNATDNYVEILWTANYPKDTNFTARYEVTVPGNASSGNYNFSGTLDFQYGLNNTPVTEPIGGDGTIAVYHTGAPQLSFAPTALSFHGVEGGPNPLYATLRIWNSGGEVLNWSVGDNATWLSEEPVNGTSAGEIDIVNISVNTSGLPVGEYPANITITPQGANATSLPVSLTIIPPSSPLRNLPVAQVYPGGTFDVWVNWTLNSNLTKNVSGIGLVDNTTVTNANGTYLWDTVSQISESPAAASNQTRGTNNTSVEYLWDTNYTPGTSFTVHYRVTVPFGTTTGIYNMTVCPDETTARLEYYVGEDAYIECISGGYQLEVLPLLPPLRDLPPVVHPGDTFGVNVSVGANPLGGASPQGTGRVGAVPRLTSPSSDDLNGIGFTDLAPATPSDWNVTADSANCTPSANFNKTTGRKIEYAWNGSYPASTNFTIRYNVTVPNNTPLGVYCFPCGDCSQSWIEYYVGEAGPYKACTEGDCCLNLAGYNLTVVSNGCCDIMVVGDSVYDIVYNGTNKTYYNFSIGEDVELFAYSADPCCALDNWTVDDVNVTTDNPITVTMDADHTAVANSSVLTYNLTVTSSGCCPIEVSGAATGTVPAGQNQTFTNITCGSNVTVYANDSDPCCVFASWSDAGAQNHTITMDSDKNVTAYCTVLTYNLTVASSGCCPIEVSGAVNGTVSAGQNQTFANITCGANVTLNATSTGNCTFNNWTIDGNFTPGNPINVTMDSDHTAVATCTPAVVEWYLTINSTTGGNVTVPGEGTFGPYANGTVVSLTATPDASYTFVNWTGDVGTITNVSAANTTITMQANYSITANFASIPPGPGGGGGGGAPPPPPTCCACDVNCDGFFDARDLTEEHRIVLLLDAPTNGSDCTRDGVIDARDVTGVKRAILWTCCGPCDPNCDGFIDARDLTKMHRIIAGIDSATPGADCNGDGKVDARDLTVLKQIVVEVQAQPQPVIVSPCRCSG